MSQEYIEARRKSRIIPVANHPEQPEIEKGVPIPIEARGGLRKYDHFYPFEKMEIGDSFWVSSSSYCTAGAVTKFSKKTGWKFISRGESKAGVANSLAAKNKRGTRVWRIG